MTSDPLRLARLAERAAARAATYLHGVRRPDSADWTHKGRSDFVTVVDRTAEAMIREDLCRAEPDSAVLGEELSPESGATRGLVWIVDPLDGTTNFLHGYPWWSVSIAAAIDGELVAGVIHHVPALRRYTAWKGGGAWSGAERLSVSRTIDPKLALLGTGFPFKTPEHIPPYLEQLRRIFPATSGVRRAGSAALDLADVAQGHLDAFWELILAPWDMAAGIVMIREAGGIITDITGAPLAPKHTGVVAGNPGMHEWLLRQIGEANQS